MNLHIVVVKTRWQNASVGVAYACAKSLMVDNIFQPLGNLNKVTTGKRKTLSKQACVSDS